MNDPTPVFDHIVVGAGTAGCLLANRLSADPRKRVLLIEAGGNDDYLWVHIPVGYLYCIGNPRTDWLYKTEPDPGLNGRSLRYPRGKVLGGCSSINGMIYMRGQRRDYDHWATVTGDARWRWDQVLPVFKQHEDHWRGASEHHAAPGFDAHGARAGGEWRVEKQRLSWAILDAFSAAAQQAGIPATDDFNRGSNEGVGYFEVNQRGGLRWNATKAFLRPVMHRDNLAVWTGAQVSRLLTARDADGRLRVTGVELRPEGHDHQRGAPLIARLRDDVAAAEVVMAAGAVGTPQILQLSGIGPGALLQRHGISVQHELPGVGANLQDHLQIRAVFEVQGVKTLNTQAASWLGKGLIGLDYLLRRRGPMSMAPSQLGCFTRSSAAQAEPNVQYHVQPLSLDAFGEPLHRFNAFTASVCNLNPTSRGTVQIRSARPEDAPAILANYLSTPEDRQVAADSLRLTRRIASQPALARYQPREVKPGLQFQSDDDLARLAGDIGTTIFHPVGTCRMGRADDAMAVVDPELRVRGVAGLRIADASVMPTITSGNTNSPTLMIAERAAALMRGI
ncbi:GMC family oxidoreductase [Aquabacterium sp. OR-4]|uniref:GMC family oxidoreductase n=1 Tax=Aquabacterium sp. OR-4 TaxID=2978127 RepID=UPI0021B49767|nr:GMC family oxidoreductase N-terminal domain-containing protein [Aquabacterium sp. OR-4]MDT7833774.1 GMC family oxidoreductase N-terminal domain-containing protein [Aquabacterium sp. OR-4]